MIEGRGWDEEGTQARAADELALIHRPVAGVSWEERELRNWWCLTATNRGPQTGDTERRGYLAPGQNVPGATPSHVPSKGGKSGKGGKGPGKRPRETYEETHPTRDQSWTWGGNSSASSSWYQRGYDSVVRYDRGWSEESYQ